MSQFTDDLFRLRGRVMAARPMATSDFVQNALNDRMRSILDSRTYWADLMKFGNLSIPDPYTTGTISLDTRSAIVTGTGTTWPVNDVVNTTIPGGIQEFGFVEVTPASMDGIVPNAMLYVDDANTPETVPVVEVNRTSFIAKFSKTHDANCTVTQSSLANLQLRLSQSYPVFTVAAVTAANSLILTLPWGGPPLTGQTYTIKLMYVMLAPNLKAIIAMKDEQTGYPVKLHVSLEEAEHRDPRRMLVAGNPTFSMIDLGSNEQGNMLYEMWPSPSAARQFSYCYAQQWPDMTADTDRPPPFINPSILFYGALADAKATKFEKNDWAYDLPGAQMYEMKFQQGVQEAKNADEAKKAEALRNPWWRNMMPGSYDQLQLQPGSWDFNGAGLF